MATPDHRSLALATCILAATLIGLPWADGGRSPVGQAALVLLLGLAGAAGFLARDVRPPLRPSPLLALGAILVGASALQTIHPDRTIHALLLLVAYLLAAALAARAARDAPWTERALLDAVSLSGLLVVGLGTLWLIRGNDGGFYANALIGPFGYPNAVAGFLLLVGGAAAAALQSDWSRIERGAALVACAACLFGLYFTRSRGAWVAVAVGCLCWASIQWQHEWSSRHLWAALAALTLLAGLSLAGSRVAGLLPFLWPGGPELPADTSVQWRLSILRWTWAMIRDHPWLGVGPGAFPVALIHYQQIPYLSGENPHNLYAEIAVEYGLIAGLLFSVGLAICLVRVAMATRRLSATHPVRGRRAALLAALVAFAIHSGMDLDWSFPAVALLAAVILGLAAAGLPPRHPRSLRYPSLWRTAALLVLAAAAILALTRYYSATLVAWGRDALAAGDLAGAEQYVIRAQHLNPLSFSAHYWQARARLQAGDPQRAMEAAERTIRMAPKDPNTHALAGEMALAAGRWEAAATHFHRAVNRAPSAHLRSHAGLFDAAAGAGTPDQALHAYARAVALFTDERVLGSEARCLAPGDRYLLARMSRRAMHLLPQNTEAANRQAAMARADRLSQPDSRGICAVGGRPGQTSPEAAVVSFWRALGEGGRAAAEAYLVPERRRPETGGSHLESAQPQRSPGVRVAWIHSLSGGPHRATVVYQLEKEDTGNPEHRCGRTATRFTPEGWFLEDPPFVDRGPCPF
jgi:putative inorganic carbon (HCO3(-)) transporter